MKNAVRTGLGRKRARTASRGCCRLPGDSTSFLSPIFPAPFPAQNRHPTLFSFLLLSSLCLSLSPGKSELCGPRRIGQRFFQTGRRTGDDEGMEPGGKPRILCPTKETHSPTGRWKQGTQRALRTADGTSGGPGAVASAPPVEDPSRTQRTSAR